MNIPQNILSTLTDELKKKVEEAKTPEELLAIAKESGRELSPEQLEAVSGGWCPEECQYCHADTVCPDACLNFQN